MFFFLYNSFWNDLDGKTRNAKNETVNKSSDNHKNPKKSNPRIITTVSVRNIKVHIAEMSADDKTGLKDEYNVNLIVYFILIRCVFF